MSFSNRFALKLRRACVIVISLFAVAVFCSDCGLSTDAETKTAVEQMNQDLQESITQLNTELQESVDQLNKDLQQSVTDLQTAVSDLSQRPETGTQIWEYNLGVVVYDDVCAVEALAPYKDNTTVKQWVDMMGGYNRGTIAVMHSSATCIGDFPDEDWMVISNLYVDCGHRVFDAYAKEMGEQEWEMVSYERIQYTWPGSQYCEGIIVDYGYEVMWKRSKSSD
jgi:hypothetical protein